jgi:hypothetical protein
MRYTLCVAVLMLLSFFTSIKANNCGTNKVLLSETYRSLIFTSLGLKRRGLK